MALLKKMIIDFIVSIPYLRYGAIKDFLLGNLYKQLHWHHYGKRWEFEYIKSISYQSKMAEADSLF